MNFRWVRNEFGLGSDISSNVTLFHSNASESWISTNQARKKEKHNRRKLRRENLKKFNHEFRLSLSQSLSNDESTTHVLQTRALYCIFIRCFERFLSLSSRKKMIYAWNEGVISKERFISASGVLSRQLTIEKRGNRRRKKGGNDRKKKERKEEKKRKREESTRWRRKVTKGIRTISSPADK